jgi:hypothetical protein
MPRFFIHVRHSDTLTEDPEGYELPNFEAARDEALAAAREIMANGLRSERLDCEHLEIHDEAGQFLITVSVRGASPGSPTDQGPVSPETSKAS